MRDASLEAKIEAAAGYEELLVPALMAQFAPVLLDAGKIRQGQRVLDVACGTGVLARAAVARVGDSGAVTGLDPGPGMLAVAQRLEPRVEWQPGAAECLPFEDSSFDAVLSQFGLMFFADPPAAVREMLRVAVPGGRLAVAVWDSAERMPPYRAEIELLDRLAGRDAADALRAPFRLGSPRELVDMFEREGARSVAVATHTGRARFPSLRTMIESDLRGWLPVVGVELEEDRIGRILEEAEAVLADVVTERGTAEFGLSAHVVTAARN